MGALHQSQLFQGWAGSKGTSTAKYYRWRVRPTTRQAECLHTGFYACPINRAAPHKNRRRKALQLANVFQVEYPETSGMSRKGWGLDAHGRWQALLTAEFGLWKFGPIVIWSRCHTNLSLHRDVGTSDDSPCLLNRSTDHALSTLGSL